MDFAVASSGIYILCLCCTHSLNNLLDIFFRKGVCFLRKRGALLESCPFGEADQGSGGEPTRGRGFGICPGSEIPVIREQIQGISVKMKSRTQKIIP